MDWGLDEGADLEVSGTGKLGEFSIKVAFEGKVFSRSDDAADSIDDRILDAHDDKLGYSYRSGRNEISISVSRGNNTSLRACMIAVLCAIVTYLPLSFLIDTQAQHGLLENYVFPLEKMYTNAMLMIGAPMTFFSLPKNLTDTYIVSKESSGVRQLQVRTLATSALAILLAAVAFFAISAPLTTLDATLYGTSPVLGSSINRSFSDVITSLVTPSIFEPFEAISPMPLVVLALLCAYALCSAGKYFDSLRHAMMACYTVFSRMLHLVIAALPLFCFIAIMDVLLDVGYAGGAEILGYFVAGILPLSPLFAAYAVRLRAAGIQVIPFTQKLVPLLRENGKIGSAIDAAPYNTRYCSRVFKMDRSMLERNLPVLAEINLDGNSVLLMFFTLALAFVLHIEISWLSLVGLGVLILFLSLGAPNQPGSILIGMLIITMYLKAPEMLCASIYLEAFCGSLQNIINVIGDIVMVAIDDAK